MRTLSRKSFAIGLLVALLVTYTGRAVPVYALAQPQIIPELAPVFDTEIIQLQDYIENNVTPPQFEIFNILLGLYVASQGGFSEYKLQDPYATQDGVLAWLKSCGIQLYNSLIGMGSIGPDPITGIDYRPFIKGAAEIAMGCAVKSTQYEDTNDFVSDVNVQEKYFIPIDFGIQGALNYIFAKNGGMYNWQFDVGEFVSSTEYDSIVLLPTSNYWTLYESFVPPVVRVNWNYVLFKNCVSNCDFFSEYTNIFLNTTDGKLYFYNDNGQYYPNATAPVRVRVLAYNEGTNSAQTDYYNLTLNTIFNYVSLDTYQDIIQYYVDNSNLFTVQDPVFFINDFVQHYYYGTSWDNKNEIFHSMNLNLDENTLPYYQQVANDYLLDIKGIIRDLILPTINLKDVILNNLYDLEGVIVTDPVLTQVAVEILESIQTVNVPLPVNLNDIAEYTDNSYLDRVKEEARRGGNALAYLVAFWHNCDAELVYVLFGAGITVLVGAFIGKWGHS